MTLKTRYDERGAGRTRTRASAADALRGDHEEVLRRVVEEEFK